jgi:hypothetical protein
VLRSATLSSAGWQTMKLRSSARRHRALHAMTNREAAQILYATKNPTRQQMKNVHPLMKHFKSTLPNRTE